MTLQLVFITGKLMRNSNKEKLKLSELLGNKYSPKSTYNGTWISDTEIAFMDTEGSFVRYDVVQNITTTIVDASIMVSIHWTNVQVDRNCNLSTCWHS